MNDGQAFFFPVRSAQVWGLDEEGQPRSNDDIAAELDMQDSAIEDYLNQTVPAMYVQFASIGSGTIDPAQLATGTPGAGKAPVGDPPVWTDIETQAEADTHAGLTTNVHGIPNTALLVSLGTQLQRGTVAWTLGAADTNTSTVVIFPAVFSIAPVVTLTVRNAAGLNLGAELTAVTSAQFTTRIFPTSGVAPGVSSGDVHWHAVKA